VASNGLADERREQFQVGCDEGPDDCPELTVKALSSVLVLPVRLSALTRLKVTGRASGAQALPTACGAMSIPDYFPELLSALHQSSRTRQRSTQFPLQAPSHGKDAVA
jgi:hypothetical protein